METINAFKILVSDKARDYTVVNLNKWIPMISKTYRPAVLEQIKNNISREEMIAFLDNIEPVIEVEKIEKVIYPTQFKKGDVLMHPIFKHPYVLLDKKKVGWICGLLTTEPTCSELLQKCESRFFNESYFTKVLFTVSEPNGNFMFPFENNKQLADILLKLKITFY